MSVRILNTLTDSAYQSVSFITNEGEKVTLTLRFIPSQQTWFLDVESSSLTTRGLALATFKNILYQFKNKITWGLYVWSIDGFDPFKIDDFSSKRVCLAVLEDLENAVIEEFLNG